MANDTIKIIWTCDKPDWDAGKVNNILGVSYLAAMAMDPTIIEINIRPDPHNTTFIGNGKWEFFDERLTLSTKNASQKAAGVFITFYANVDKHGHIYRWVTNERDNDFETRDGQINRRTGKPIWNLEKTADDIARAELVRLSQGLDGSG